MSQGRLLAARIVKKTIEAHGICSFELADAAGGPLPRFSAGSHIDVHAGDTGIVRQYSLFDAEPPSSPADRESQPHRWRIAVLRDPASRGGSAWLFEQAAEGDELLVSEPRNHFPLAHEAAQTILFAGGIGITPLLCMAERLGILDQDFRLHYSTRSRAHTAFHDRIASSRIAPRVSFHFDDRPDEPRLDVEAVLRAAHPQAHLYVCGPKGYNDRVLTTARDSGWPRSRAHWEYFGAPVQKAAGDASFTVRIASTGRSYAVPGDTSVADALAAHGIEIPVSCGQGVCGLCLTRVLEGEPDHRDHFLSDRQKRRNDQFIACCSRAKSGVLVLDL